eukprot:sb/3476797/
METRVIDATTFSSTMHLFGAANSDGGSYKCVANYGSGNVTSNEAILLVGGKSTIIPDHCVVPVYLLLFINNNSIQHYFSSRGVPVPTVRHGGQFGYTSLCRRLPSWHVTYSNNH